MDTAFLNGPDKEAQKGLKNFQKNSNMYVFFRKGQHCALLQSA